MLSTPTLKELIEQVQYKPGWSFHVAEPDGLQGPYLFIEVEVANAYDPDKTVILYINSPIPSLIKTHANFFEWVMWRIRQAEIHELMEFYRVDGEIYLDPHQELRYQDGETVMYAP